MHKRRQVVATKRKANKSIYLAKGNKKLAKSILVWSIPAVKTCPNCRDCKDSCYARKAELQYPPVLPCREQNLAETKKPYFVADMINKISTMVKHAQVHKVKAVRIHESGDFYSKKYAEKWADIARAFPGLTFYGYTKAPENLPESMPENMNIVHSVLPCGSINFGSHTDMVKLAKKHHATICPYGIAKRPFTCGIDCKACLTKKHVVFIQH